jgi:DNA-binding NarL/FixJ family response regulator
MSCNNAFILNFSVLSDINPSIIIADDHPLVLKGLKDFLIQKNFNVLASAKNGKEALSLLKVHRPDIAILDIKMPFYSGLDIAEYCFQSELPTKIILITFEKDEATYQKARTLNVYGYILKEFALDEIETCITAVSKNRSYFSAELVDYIETNDAYEKLKVLTKTELKVLGLMSKTKTANEIAEELFISVRTVEKHKSNIRTKLELGSTSASLYLFAQEISTYFKNT